MCGFCYLVCTPKQFVKHEHKNVKSFNRARTPRWKIFQQSKNTKMRSVSTKRKHQNEKCSNKAQNTKSRLQKIMQQSVRKMQKSTTKEQNVKQLAKHEQSNKRKQ
jgi:hypothetical protein